MDSRQRVQRQGYRRRRFPSAIKIAHVLEVEGDLGRISPAWAGYVLQGEELRTPEGETWTVPRLRAWAFERQLIDQYKRMLNAPQGRLF